MTRPVLRHIANLWTLMQHPARENEWSLEQKLRAIQEAGFDGVCWAGSPELCAGAKKFGLIFVGGMASGSPAEFPSLLKDLKDNGAHHVNVQLATDDILTPAALGLALALLQEGGRLGLEPAIESHRGTCTETPEKTYALADAYQKLTGELLPISWDFSHFAVVKHLVPGNFIERLLVRPDLIRRAQQFHFRPFNGHHVQVPITDGKGSLTPEVKDWLPFAEALLKCWLDGNRNSSREIFICPELGPVDGGYALSTFPNSWEEAKVLRGEIDKLWKRLTA
jgi:sugar phosphate isomerase/epimerase